MGCGCGAVSLIGTHLAKKCSVLTLTDGNEDAVSLAKENFDNYLKIWKSTEAIVNFSTLLWGAIDICNKLCQDMNEKRRYDIAIGCELFYYRTEIDALLTTAMNLISSNGNILNIIIFHIY